jgi:hypothetical protein
VAVHAGVIDLLLGVGFQTSVLVQSGVTAVGFAAVACSLYAE